MVIRRATVYLDYAVLTFFIHDGWLERWSDVDLNEMEG